MQLYLTQSIGLSGLSVYVELFIISRYPGFADLVEWASRLDREDPNSFGSPRDLSVQIVLSQPNPRQSLLVIEKETLIDIKLSYQVYLYK